MATRRNTDDRPPSHSRRRAASDLLAVAGLLDHVEGEQIRESGMSALRETAADMGMRLHSFEVTHAAMPDPLIDALPETEQDRIQCIVHRLYDDPASQHDELAELVAAHPHIPSLRNHLACALITTAAVFLGRDGGHCTTLETAAESTHSSRTR